jgi:nicotinate-nucleotide adenylyltransferase
MTYFFGGTFDPPHVGHYAIVRHLLEKSPDTKVIVMPAPQAPLRAAEKCFSYRERFQLLRLMFRHEIGSARVLLSVLEKRLPPPHFTISTLEALKSFCSENPVVVIGGDQAEKMPQWHRVSELVAGYRFVIFARAGAFAATLPEMRYETIGDFSYDISSTALRNRLLSLDSVQRFAEAQAIARVASSQPIK